MIILKNGMPKHDYSKKLKVDFATSEKKFLINSSVTGFALVELLVAISIFAVVITIVYTTLYTGIKAYHKAQGQLRLNREINQILDKLAVELRNCYDAEYNEEEDVGGFIADAQILSFFTIQNVYSEDGFNKLLARVSYNFRDGALFKKIQLDENVFLDEEDFEEEELISDIQDFNFEYLYFKKIFFEEEYPYEWKPQWSDKSLIPKGIRVQISIFDPEMNTSVSLKRYIFLMQGDIPAQE